MKNQLEKLVQTAIDQLQKQSVLPEELTYQLQFERPRDPTHGDFASNVALTLAKPAQCKPRELAEKIVAAIPAADFIERINIAGPGFINFVFSNTAALQIVPEILAGKENYGRSNHGKKQKIHMEFVSSNPTGPLHVGHGRGAAYGATVADLLDAIGFDVHREYYVNDGGRQMDILATSVWLRYLQQQNVELVFPSNGYQGDYIVEIAKQLTKKYQQQFCFPQTEIFNNVPADEPQGGDKELHIDALIANAKNLLKQNYRIVFDAALDTILVDIRDDLAEFGVNYQEWFSERSLMEGTALNETIAKLKASNHTYEREGALWFNSSAFGDDKDRVLIRENGQPTYFASDAAYRWNILQRGYTNLINVLGADHHGYVARIRAVIKALGYDDKVLTVPLVQFAVLYRGKERVQMSTRSGSFVTLRELREEVGKDAARFFYVMRKCEHHMDFDLELAKSESNDNPVYYIQYAHARICSVFRQMAEKNFSYDEKLGLQSLDSLTESHEQDLLRELARYSEVVEVAALQYEPHLLVHYLRELAQAFHTYYNSHTFLVPDEKIRNARLALVVAVRYLLSNGLKLLGVSAPENM